MKRWEEWLQQMTRFRQRPVSKGHGIESIVVVNLRKQKSSKRQETHAWGLQTGSLEDMRIMTVIDDCKKWNSFIFRHRNVSVTGTESGYFANAWSFNIVRVYLCRSCYVIFCVWSWMRRNKNGIIIAAMSLSYCSHRVGWCLFHNLIPHVMRYVMSDRWSWIAVNKSSLELESLESPIGRNFVFRHYLKYYLSIWHAISLSDLPFPILLTAAY
jgi:hypothetical protein